MYKYQWICSLRSLDYSILSRTLPFLVYVLVSLVLPKSITSHLPGLNSICHFQAHFNVIREPKTTLHMIINSANLLAICDLTDHASYIHTLIIHIYNKHQESQGWSCGTPSPYFSNCSINFITNLWACPEYHGALTIWTSLPCTNCWAVLFIQHVNLFTVFTKLIWQFSHSLQVIQPSLHRRLIDRQGDVSWIMCPSSPHQF